MKRELTKNELGHIASIVSKFEHDVIKMLLKFERPMADDEVIVLHQAVIGICRTFNKGEADDIEA